MKKSSAIMAKVGSGSLVAGLAAVILYMSKLAVSADTLSSTETLGAFKYVFIIGIVFILISVVMFVLAAITND